MQLFEMLVQAGLNGAAIALVAGQLQSSDPTFGIPFSMSLYQAQPQFEQKIELLASQLSARVAQASQRMAAPPAKA